MMGNPWDNDPIVSGPAANAGTPVTKLSPDDSKALSDMTEELQMKRLVAQRAQQFMKAQGTGASAVATGPGYGNLPVVGDFVPNLVRAAKAVVDPQGARRLSDLDAISGKTWELLRPKGSGPIRGYEAQGLKQGFPSVVNPGDTNAKLAADLQSEYEDHLHRTQFAQNFVRTGRGSVADAEVAYERMLQGQQTPRQAGNAMMQQRSAQSRSGGFGYVGPG